MDSMNPLLAAAIGSIIRWGLAFVGGYLVSHGIWTSEENASYVAAGAAAGAALIWGLYQKYRTRITILKALNAPAGSSEEQVRRAPESGIRPFASRP